MTTRRAFLLSISSDIATHLAHALIDAGWAVEGTFRTASAATEGLAAAGARLRALDVSSADRIDELVADPGVGDGWDLLMLSPATMNPIGRFDECDWPAWQEGFLLNSVRQLQVLHGMLGRRGRTAPLVFLWSGPGSNSAPERYSALTAAKVVQIKMCELLAAEYPDCRFVIVGPGWVDTKTHLETLAAGDSAGGNAERTRARLESGRTTSLALIEEFLWWVLDQPAEVVSGRNFSIQGDLWGEEPFSAMLRADGDALKLRRAANDWRPGATATRYSAPEYRGTVRDV